MIKDQPVRPVRQDGWTPARRLRFLAALEECADVSVAARACGMSRQSAYVLRRRDPEFARHWDAARAEMFARQEREYLAVVADLQVRALRKIAYWEKSSGHCAHVHPVSTLRDHAISLGNKRIG